MQFLFFDMLAIIDTSILAVHGFKRSFCRTTAGVAVIFFETGPLTGKFADSNNEFT